MRPGIFPPFGPVPERRTEETPETALASGTTSWHRPFHSIRKRSALLMWVALLALSLLVVFLLWRTSVGIEQPLTSAEVYEAVAEAIEVEQPDQVDPTQIYQAILPSLVVVHTDNAKEEEGVGVGSGVVVNVNGVVLTALHLVDGATEIHVSFADGTRTQAVVAGADTTRDIAVLAPFTQPSFVVPATIGASSSLQVGDEVFAVGNPLGLAGSMSAGVVSGLDREVKLTVSEQSLRGLIQFDAAVNSGNSGGPLLDRRGQVVGIVTGLVNPTDQEVFIGIGFAVPIDQALGGAGGPAQ